uniref:ARAD1D44880p n=1 Tax=Blastobotrys adeninivorans TaxID=409370 RepID=A0A060TJ76_BLAAD
MSTNTDEPRKGLITNPSIVQSALKNQGQTKPKKDRGQNNQAGQNNQPQGNKAPKAANKKQKPKAPTSQAGPNQSSLPNQQNQGGQNGQNGARAKKKSQKPVSQQPVSSPRKSPPATPKTKEEPSLKEILFPDLYGKGSGPSAAPRAPLTPPRNPSPARNSPHFAGASFHSSPAPSALPKPSFKLKSTSAGGPQGRLFQQSQVTN